MLTSQQDKAPFFTQRFIDFFEGLSSNNSKQWFDANRNIYEKEVKKPFTAFVNEMIMQINKHEPEVEIKPSDAIMRINKDIRFSKDKIPYNTHVAANISAFGKKDKGYPGFYFQFSHEKIRIIGGSYMIEPERLQKIREYIAEHPEGFNQACTDSDFLKRYKEVKGDKNKRLPKDFLEMLDRVPLIANKQFFYESELSADWILKDGLADKLMEFYLAGKPLNDFLKDALAE